MGNLLESESSTPNSEEETEDFDATKERTAGDGMECELNNTLAHGSQRAVDKGVGIGASNPEANDSVLKETSITETEDLKKAKEKVAKSPSVLPSKELLIPIKPQKSLEPLPILEPISKQKNPKFVPYEPYSGATKPMTTKKGHTRKSSDSSSIISQGSMTSGNCAKALTDQELTVTDTIRNDNCQAQWGQQNVQTNQNHSVVLLKERLKISQKELEELQQENHRLKKLMVDSMTGGEASSNTDFRKSNTHDMKESMDSLSDEIEVWRSKFLSSCVLVEQLTKDNNELVESIKKAADLIQELKHASSLTQSQYENINSWLKKANTWSNNTAFRSESMDVNANDYN